jgi:C_GCAxxG_C_C family probable redox protein
MTVVDKAPKRSRDLFSSGYYCAESVLLSIAEDRSIQSELIPRIATGFCGGVSHTSGMCGAVSGAIMAMGLVFGRNSPVDSVDATYSAVKRFMAMFQERFGSTNCLTLTGCNLDTDEGQRLFMEKNVIEQCQCFVEEATRLATTVIEDQLKTQSN